MITWKLEIEHAQALLALLGQQPTSSGAYPLLVDLSQQTQEQAKAPAEAVEPAELV